MHYDNYNFGGMHFVWWLIWMTLIFRIFSTTYNISGQRTKKHTPLDMLKKRFPSGEITQKQYLKHNSLLEK
jgi:putative membrane protein